MNEWTVKHKTDDLWLGMYGWSYAQDRALRFRFREEAEEWARDKLPAGTWSAQEFRPDDERRPDVQSDYDPFGLRQHDGRN